MSYTNWINSIIFSPDVFWNGYDFSIFVENNFLSALQLLGPLSETNRTS